jgi:uncharacterized protein YeaO (DUF488 family)
VTRFRGRDLQASRYDVWMPNLGPSERLLRAGQDRRISWAQFSLWLQRLMQRRHNNVAAIALANKIARIAWAVLTRRVAYSPA